MTNGKRVTLKTDRRGWTVATLWTCWIIPHFTTESRRQEDAEQQARYWEKRFNAPVIDKRPPPNGNPGPV